jgi:tRNA pseudouridine38-40 synthase
VKSTTEKKNIRLIIAYDGSSFYGWQRQRGKPTIQGTIEEKIAVMVREPVSLIGAGRTDAGVHALHQVANFRISSSLTPSIFLTALNAQLPPSIVIKAAEYVPFDFHARYDARSKVYEYRVLNESMPSPFLTQYVWHIARPLKVALMEECLRIVEGSHDFSSFCSPGDGKINPVRNMMRAELETQREDFLTFAFEANGFLRHMIRTLMGTLIKVGLGRLSVSDFIEILESRGGQHPGAKAPPSGLYLRDVKY